MSLSIWAMRAVMVDSVSLDRVICPCRIWSTKSLIRSLPRSRAAASRVNRPSCTIWSSRLADDVCSGLGAATFGVRTDSAMILPLWFEAQFVAEFLLLLRIADDLVQHVIEPGISLETAAQVGQVGPQVQQLLQRLYVPGHLLRI